MRYDQQLLNVIHSLEIQIIPCHRKAQKTYFLYFQSLHAPQKRLKHDTLWDMAAFLRHCKKGRKRCRKITKTPKKAAKGAQKGRNISRGAVFVAFLQVRKKMKKSQNPFTMSLGHI